MEQGLRVFDGPKVRRLRCCRAGSRLRALLRSRAPRTGTGHTAGNRLGTGSVPRGCAPCPRSLHCAPRWEPCRAVPPACASRALRAPGQARRWDPRWAWSGGWQVAEGSGSPTAFWFCFVLFSSSFSFNLLSAQFCYS